MLALETRVDIDSSAGLRAAPEPLLVAEDIWFGYDRRAPILHGVSLTVERGSMTMIVGRSGSGKTTLLKILKGLLQPQRGVVRAVTSGEEGFTFARRRIAYVPQTLGLVRAATALENALVGALSRTGTVRSLLKWFPRDTVDEARELLARLGLADKAGAPVHRLSGGERQRVAIARALMQRPTLILADEFVSQLDPATSEDVLRLMRDIAATGVSMLIATHETDVVAGFADRLVILREGRVAYDDLPDRLPRRQMLELLR